MDAKKQNDEITLKGLFDIFLPKIWLIIIIAVIFGGAVGGYSMFLKTDTYTAAGTLVMNKIPTKYSDDTTASAVTTGLNANEIEAIQALIGMSNDLMKTREFVASIKEALVQRDERYVTITPEQIKSMLSIKVVGAATCFEISATSADSKLAYDVVDIVYNSLPGLVEDVFDSYSISIKNIDMPIEPTSPNSKNTVRNAIVAAVAGALLAAIIVFIISRTDVVVRSREKLEQTFDIPILGVIPKIEFDSKN